VHCAWKKYVGFGVKLYFLFNSLLVSLFLLFHCWQGWMRTNLNVVQVVSFGW